MDVSRVSGESVLTVSNNFWFIYNFCLVTSVYYLRQCPVKPGLDTCPPVHSGSTGHDAPGYMPPPATGRFNHVQSGRIEYIPVEKRLVYDKK